MLEKSLSQRSRKTKFLSDRRGVAGHTESLCQKGKDAEARLLLDAVFQAISENGLLNEFYIEVLAYHYSSHRSYQIATEILKKQTEHYPESPRAYVSLAQEYFRQGKEKPAAKYFKKVLELDKNNSIAKQMLEKLD